MKSLIQDRSYWSEVWERFRTGDEKAFSRIYTQFIDSLYAYGCKFARDHELVKDCIHDVFLDLKRLQPNLNKPEFIEFYLFKSLKNAIFHKIKWNSRINIMPVEELVFFDLKFNIERDYFDLEFDSLRREKLKKILMTLDPKKRELLFLKFNTGLSYIEIGELLEMNPDAVKKQVYRTLDSLRVKYGSQLLELLFIFHS